MPPKIVGSHYVKNHAENLVLSHLRSQLPDDWVVVVDVAWTINENGYFSDGQADYVIFVPNLGMLILEVKGSYSVKVDENGKWFRKERYGTTWFEIFKIPFRQACSNSHILARRLSNYLTGKNGTSTNFPALYGYAVTYPNGALVKHPTVFDKTLLLTKDEQGDYKNRIVKILEGRQKTEGTTKAIDFTHEDALDFARYLVNHPFEITHVDEDESIQDFGQNSGEVIERLTQLQFAALQGLFRYQYVAVSGPAGSGKTILAIMRLRELIKNNKRAIYFCYTKQLAENLRRQHPDLSHAIYSIDAFFKQQMLHIDPSESGAQNDPDTYFQSTLPSKIYDHYEMVTNQKKYDAIILDEGQDFNSERIWAVNAMCKKKGQYVCFFDRNQELFQNMKEKLLEIEIHYLLQYNCRNTKQINRYCNEKGRLSIKSMEGILEGQAVDTTLCEDKTKLLDTITNIGKNYLSQNKSIVILSPFVKEKSIIAPYIEPSNLEIAESIETWSAGNNILFSTIKSFKGMEADIVIVVDAPLPDASVAFTKHDFYVACTRAKEHLCFLTTEPEMYEFLRSR